MSEGREVQSQHLQRHLTKFLDDWATGKTQLKEMIGLSEEEIYTVASQGYRLFLQGKYQAARIIFEGLVATDPLHGYYYRALGAIYWGLKQPHKAIKQYSNAIQLAPDDLLSYLGRAEIYVAEKNHTQASYELKHVIEKATREQKALKNKALAMLHMLAQNA